MKKFLTKLGFILAFAVLLTGCPGTPEIPGADTPENQAADNPAAETPEQETVEKTLSERIAEALGEEGN